MTKTVTLKMILVLQLFLIIYSFRQNRVGNIHHLSVIGHENNYQRTEFL